MTRKLPEQFLGAMTQAQIDNLEQSSPGDIVFNLDTLSCQVWTGSQWTGMAVGSGGSVVVGAYLGNGLQAGQVIKVGGKVQYVRIFHSYMMVTPGYLTYAEKYDVWYNPKDDKQYWIEYKNVEGKGLSCYVHETYIDNGIFFQPEDGFGVLGFSPLLNGKDQWYTYFVVLSDGRDKSKEFHIPQVGK